MQGVWHPVFVTFLDQPATSTICFGLGQVVDFSWQAKDLTKMCINWDKLFCVAMHCGNPGLLEADCYAIGQVAR